MFLQGAAARREETCLVSLKGRGLTNGRPSGPSGALSAFIPPLRSFFSFFSRRASSAGAFACRTRVPVQACARAGVRALCSAPGRLQWATPAMATAAAPIGSRSMCFPVPIMFPSDTPCQHRAPRGNLPRLLKLLWAPKGPEIKEGDKRELYLNPFGIQFVKWPEPFNSLSPFCSEQRL